MRLFSRSKHKLLLIAAALALSASPALGQDAVHKASPFIPLKEEPAPRLHVDPPLAEPLAARGTAYTFHDFRTAGLPPTNLDAR